LPNPEKNSRFGNLLEAFREVLSIESLQIDSIEGYSIGLPLLGGEQKKLQRRS